MKDPRRTAYQNFVVDFL